MKPICVQLNWARQVGGGEVYTRSFSAALVALGWDVRLVVDKRADFWREMNLHEVKLIPSEPNRALLEVLPKTASVVIGHMLPDLETAKAICVNHRLGGVVHMPLYNRKLDPSLKYCHQILGVSNYVLETILDRGLTQVYSEPLWGVGDLAPRAGSAHSIVRTSEYEWDKRKYRDKFLSLANRLLPETNVEFARRSGLTLAIISRITPIKQFPLMLSYLAPILAEFPNVNLEIFGSGGYASVRDLRRQLRPMGQQVRWWGQQSNPAAIYPNVDYVLSGLPEKEALGLNLIEAQVMGTPVLAVDAPPFTETVAHGKTGFLFPDPRCDDGNGFRALLKSIQNDNLRVDRSDAAAHLGRFSLQAFTARVGRAMSTLMKGVD